MEMTLEQQRALALARARMRMSGEDFAAVKAEGGDPLANANATITPPPEFVGPRVTFMGMEGMPSPFKNGPPIPFSVHGGRAITDAFEKGSDFVGGSVTDLAAPHMRPEAAGALGAAAKTGIHALPMMIGGGKTAKAVPTLANRMEKGAILKSQNAMRDATLKAGQAEGYKMPPSEVHPTWLGNQLESLSGKEALRQDAIHGNAQVTNALARRAASMPADAPITETTLKAAQDVVTQPYRDVAALPGLPPKDIVEWPRNLEGVRYSQYPRLSKGPTPQTPAESLHDLKAVRLRAKDHWTEANRSGSVLAKDAAEALDAKALALEADLEQAAVASGNAGLVDALREARMKSAKIHDVERAMNEGTGNVSAPRIGSALAKGAPLTGELETIGRFQQAFPKFMGEVEKAPTGGVGKLRWYGAGMLGAGGATAMGPAGAGLAALPLIGDAVRATLLSKYGQKLLVRPSYPGEAAKSLARLGILGGQEAMIAQDKEKREALIRALKQEQR